MSVNMSVLLACCAVLLAGCSRQQDTKTDSNIEESTYLVYVTNEASGDMSVIDPLSRTTGHSRLFCWEDYLRSAKRHPTCAARSG